MPRQRLPSRLRVSRHKAAIHGVINTLKHLTNADTLIETGTYMGDTTLIASEYFGRVLTIELSDQLFEDARDRLVGVPNIIGFRGDSKTVLPQLLELLSPKESVVFYLDAHYFKRGLPVKQQRQGLIPSTSPFPLYEELQTIANRQTTAADVVLVDDMHLWGKRTPSPEWEHVTARRVLRRLQPRVALDMNFFLNKFCAWVGPSPKA